MRASQGGRGGRGKRGRKLRRAREASSVKVSDRSDACLPQLENSLHQCDFFHVQLARYQVKYIFMRLQLVICYELPLQTCLITQSRARSLQPSHSPIPVVDPTGRKEDPPFGRATTVPRRPYPPLSYLLSRQRDFASLFLASRRIGHRGEGGQREGGQPTTTSVKDAQKIMSLVASPPPSAKRRPSPTDDRRISAFSSSSSCWFDLAIALDR